MAGPEHFRVLIVGGGTGGICVAARLCRLMPRAGIGIVEPSDKHYYQPLWTLVAGGDAARENTVRDEASLIPHGARWLRDSVIEFDPEKNAVKLASGASVTYDALVVAAGIQLDWAKVKGLPDALGKGGVCSNYSYETVAYTWQAIRDFSGGDAVFTHPATPIKCGGAPQKIMYLADDAFRRKGVRARSKVHFYIGDPVIFKCEKYARTLLNVVARKDIAVHYRHNLTELRTASREAVFQNLETNTELVQHYDMIHVTPPMSSPDFIKKSPLANAAGWVDVDKATLRHVKHANVFSLGDCSSLPTSKTGAAIRKQAPVLVQNLVAALDGKALPGAYDGYTSCPLVTGYGKLVLAEFDYDLKPRETFPIDQSKERWSMYQLKKHLLPAMYWHGMMKGRA